MNNSFDQFGDIGMTTARQVFEIAKNEEKRKKYREYIENEPIKQNKEIIEESKITRQLLEELKEDIKKPKITDWIIIVISFLTLLFTIIQLLK